MIDPVEPIETASPHRHDETIISHPAFASIRATRMTGGTHLFGSDFAHNGFIRITIAKAENHRSLSRDWHYDREELVSVDLSAAQWAHFVSTMNAESTQATLVRHNGQGVAPIQPMKMKTVDRFKKEAKETTKDALDKLNELEKMIVEMGLPQKKTEALLRKIGSSRQELNANLPFVLSQFGEHMEEITQKAKIEITSYGENYLRRTGLAAIAGQSPAPIIEISEDKKS